jgi:hypothetical protein
MDLEETMDIAEKLGIDHPENKESKTPYVMTTDFMITLNINGKESYKSRTIKPVSDLEKRNCIEHFEIERRYWAKRGIDWGIATDMDIPKILVSNIDWAYYSYDLTGSASEVSELLYYGELLKGRLDKSNERIVTIAAKFDKEMNLEPGTSLDIIKHLIARKEVKVDMYEKPITSCSAESIRDVIRKNDRLDVI